MFTLTMETRNAAFVGADDDYGPGPEVARILRELADKLDSPGVDNLAGNCIDFNGNRVGRFDLVPD